MAELCLICYTNYLPINATLKCGFKICEQCLINWVQAEAKYEFVVAGRLGRSVEQAIQRQTANNYAVIIETVKCVNVECQRDNNGLFENRPADINHRLTFEEVVDFVQKSDKSECKAQLDKVLFDILTPNCRSLFKCPRQGCDFVGFADANRRCAQQLECDKCHYSWTEASLEPLCSKLKKCCCSWNLNISLFNELQKVWRAQACPGCGICIIKNEGCKHMVCQKCKHEFCWLCLDDYYAYNHRYELLCPFRNIIKYILYLYVLTFTFNLKLAIQYVEYQNVLIDIANVIGALLLGNLITLTILFLSICCACYESFQYSSNDCEIVCKNLARLMVCLYPLMWGTGMVLLYIYWPFARLMAWYLLWQWVAIISLCFIIGICTWVYYIIQRKLEDRRARIYFEAAMENQYNDYPDIEQGRNKLDDPLLAIQIDMTRRLIEESKLRDFDQIADHISDIEPSFVREFVPAKSINISEANLEGIQRLWEDPDDEQVEGNLRKDSQNLSFNQDDKCQEEECKFDNNQI